MGEESASNRIRSSIELSRSGLRREPPGRARMIRTLSVWRYFRGRPSFGPAPPEEWGPPASGPHRVLTHAELRVGDAFGAEPDPALLAVTVDELLEAIATLPLP